MKPLIIHGHFYQPPRENPWTGIVEEQPSAAPFHDWNERVHFECYRANAFVRVGGSEPDERFVNNYENISFNFGPTLLTWLETHHGYTYARIIEADRQSALRHNGHGNAIAQAYGHVILPLCNDRDLRTQIRWGLADFRYRFGRKAESMWLPETACSDRVMSALIDSDLRYVILAPHQAARYGTACGSKRVDNEVNTGSGSTRMKARSTPALSIATFTTTVGTNRSPSFSMMDQLHARLPSKIFCAQAATSSMPWRDPRRANT